MELPEFLEVVERLADFSLVDELEHQAGMWEGCDAIFTARRHIDLIYKTHRKSAKEADQSTAASTPA